MITNKQYCAVGSCINVLPIKQMNRRAKLSKLLSVFKKNTELERIRLIEKINKFDEQERKRIFVKRSIIKTHDIGAI